MIAGGRRIGEIEIHRVLEMVMPFDRRAFLERYCDTPTLVCTAHFPLPSAGRVVRAGNAFRFVYDDQPWASARRA